MSGSLIPFLLTGNFSINVAVARGVRTNVTDFSVNVADSERHCSISINASESKH